MFDNRETLISIILKCSGHIVQFVRKVTNAAPGNCRRQIVREYNGITFSQKSCQDDFEWNKQKQ